MKLNCTILFFMFLSYKAVCKEPQVLKLQTVSSIRSKTSEKQAGSDSRFVNFQVKVTDARYGNKMFVISIYDKDPSQGGVLLSEGSATLELPFLTKIYLYEKIQSVYILRTAFDNSTVSSIVSLDSVNVNVSL